MRQRNDEDGVRFVNPILFMIHCRSWLAAKKMTYKDRSGQRSLKDIADSLKGKKADI